MDRIDPLTTGQAADYCHVSQATIVNWIKKGELRAYVTPGGHYRIVLADFLDFLEEYGMPVHPALAPAPPPRLLVLGDGPVAARVRRTLGNNGPYEVLWARSQFEAGALVERFRPTAVVIDVSQTLPSCVALCGWLRDFETGVAISVLAVGNPDQRQSALASGADSFLAKAAVADGLLRELDALKSPRPGSANTTPAGSGLGVGTGTEPNS
jgi:excisionase family DNA binding protein